MKAYVIYILVFIVILTSSCSTIIQIPVKFPPEFTFDDENKTVVIINNFDVSALNLANPGQIDVYNSGVENLIIGLTDSVSESDDIKFIVCDSLVKIEADRMFSTDTFPDYKVLICSKHSASKLLVINNFEIFINKSDNYDDSFEPDDVTSRDFYLGVRAGFDLFSNNGKLIESSTVEEIKHHKSRVVLIDWFTITPSVSRAGKNVDLVSYSVGRKYRGKFYPGTDYVDRHYYTGKIFKESKSFIKNGDWENARKVLLKMTESTDPKISQEKVAHNLSVVYEALGNIDSATNRDSK
jgi:hypothetical protein